ncbi:MAG: hypothetical protein GX421_07055 [Caldisericales bacterium]|nr:hypothetical protein [Caldisericales bacterium]
MTKDTEFEGNQKKRLLTYIWVIFVLIAIFGFVLFLAPNSGQIKSYVFRTSGEVTIFNPSSESWEGAKQGDELSTSFRIRTASGSWAEVRLDDGSLLRIGENTELEIISLYINPMMGIRSARWLMKGYGSIYVNTGETGSIYDIIAPGFVASATKGTMRVNGDGMGNFLVRVPNSGSDATVTIGNMTTRIPPLGQARIDPSNHFKIEKSVIDESDAWNTRMDAPDLKLFYEKTTSEEKETVLGKTNPLNIILLDGQEVAKSSVEGTFEIEIKLPIGKIKYTIKSIDPAGRYAEQQIEIERLEKSDHQLAITNPQDGAAITGEKVTIEGMAKGSVLLTLNGKPVQLSQEQFKIDFQPAEGENRLEFISKDRNGKIITKTLVFTKHRPMPQAQLTITSPPDGTQTESGNIIISGHSDTEYVSVGSRTTSVEKGFFSITVPLDFGRNSIVVMARSEQKKTASRTVVVYRSRPNSTKPEIAISSTVSLTNKESVRIRGTCKNAKIVQFQNQTVEPAENGGFEFVATLDEGTNNLTIFAQSPDGGTNSASISVIKDSIPPDLSQLKATRVIGETKVVISGRLEHNCTLLVNGLAIPQKDVFPGVEFDSIIHIVTSISGDTVIVVGRDQAGNEGRLELKIEQSRGR